MAGGGVGQVVSQRQDEAWKRRARNIGPGNKSLDYVSLAHAFKLVVVGRMFPVPDVSV